MSEFMRFAGNLWPVSDLTDPETRLNRFLGRDAAPLRSLVEALILHSTVVIPTDDFLILDAIALEFGWNAVEQLIDEHRITFVRCRGTLALTSDPALGLAAFEFEHDGKLTPVAQPLDSLLGTIIGNSPYSRRTKAKIARKIIDATVEVRLRDLEIDLRQQTQLDLTAHKHLSHVIVEPHDTELPDSRSTFTMFGRKRHNLLTADDAALAMAYANLELLLAARSGATDVATVTPIGQVLRAKASRWFGDRAAGSFTALRQITGLPDVGAAVLRGTLSLSSLLRVTRTKNAEEFREWLQSHSGVDPVELARQYVAVVGEVPTVQAFGTKVLRFILTSAASSVPVVGGVLNAIDAFVVERALRGVSPKYFLEELDAAISAG